MSNNNDLINTGWKNPPDKNKSIVCTTVIGDEPPEEQIKAYMLEHNVGYYVALEQVRKTTYKKI